MMNMISLSLHAVFLVTCIVLHLHIAKGAYVGSNGCGIEQFSCEINNLFGPRFMCKSRDYFCDGNEQCIDGYDENYCDKIKTTLNGGCPDKNYRCNDGRCIPEHWRCNGLIDCKDVSDEYGCEYPNEMVVEPALLAWSEKEFLGVSLVKRNLINWFLGRRKQGATTNKWGHELPRTAVALFLADKSFFTPENKTMEEMSYELSIQLLSYINRYGEVNKKDLATNIQAMMVTCIDPRNFYGKDLVSELRSKVEDSGNATNPFEILVLCNAGDKMTVKDVERISTVYKSRSRPFWIDNQAMATIALACISTYSDVPIDERTLIEMEQELKKRQFRNGTVENMKTTALVVQALIATQSYKAGFDLESAIKVFLRNQKSDGSIGSFLDSYYILPALSNSSLVDISSDHCKRPTTSEEEALSEFQRTRGERLSTQYSVWIGTEVDLKKTWTLKVPLNSTLYDILEIANRLDTRQRIAYNVIDGKPYVSSLTGLQDDLELGLYWFTYLRTQNSEEDLKLVEDSPVDVKIIPNQELILWYKSG